MKHVGSVAILAQDSVGSHSCAKNMESDGHEQHPLVEAAYCCGKVNQHNDSKETVKDETEDDKVHVF